MCKTATGTVVVGIIKITRIYMYIYVFSYSLIRQPCHIDNPFKNSGFVYECEDNTNLSITCLRPFVVPAVASSQDALP